ncbi:MAG: DUF1538 domain-containing protein [Candidatus Scalindua rubra]|uniref:DUF1538 domain-containing protein n=1 Tax=Candidatus Scalindua brodae TaxID=237368 RepID=A0A0B0EHZ7_9BACT|nr:MAG: hypothetical protein SCABRO_03952 [Candidatus Scalindua brodae]MBZ0110214.1 DUF1538 domain-containing protein [Candidatus Scalindua rubra]TWU29024.1 hypothetical protein S225a_26620 [Candidatus Brocadiaceae bacterium S225]
MDLIYHSADVLLGTFKDVLPIIGVIMFFQLIVIRTRIDNPGKLAYGFFLVVIGLAIFMIGLEKGLFPLGEAMSRQLTDADFLANGDIPLLEEIKKTGTVYPSLYFWTYIFGFCIGFSTTIAEPALIAVALKAKEVSTGAISSWGLRLAVALGVAIGISLGCYRIVTGSPLHWYIIAGYLVVVCLTFVAPKMIIPLAYDSGGVTTSTVTVPLVAALGIGLASNVPGRSVIVDAFGLIAFASLFPIISVLGYGIISERIANKSRRKSVRGT